MKKKFPKLVTALVAVLTPANVFSLTGCGKTENMDSQTNKEVQFEISETEQAVTSVHTDAEVQTDEQSVETGGIMRAYSDKEKKRMAELQQSYQSETAKPEKIMLKDWCIISRGKYRREEEKWGRHRKTDGGTYYMGKLKSYIGIGIEATELIQQELQSKQK